MMLFTRDDNNKHCCLLTIICCLLSGYKVAIRLASSPLTMRLTLALSSLLLTAPALQTDLDPNVRLTEEEFEEHFHVAPAEDPAEEERRAEALRQNEANIRDNNEKFEEGEITWFDKLNEFSNLPGYEAEAEKTGVTDEFAEYGRGVVDDLQEVDEQSERYFAMFRSRRGLDLPESYNSVALDHVSPVKSQVVDSRSVEEIFTLNAGRLRLLCGLHHNVCDRDLLQESHRSLRGLL